MTRPLASIGFFALLSAAAFGQATKAPTKTTFQVADVHASATAGNLAAIEAGTFPRYLQGGTLRDGRYGLRNATMLDLIKTAYGIDADAVFGGPSWLEWDHFDVVAKAPANTSPANVRVMLQALLADRFKLVVHKDTKPIQGFVLSTGKGKHKLKEAGGSGEHGCQAQPLGPPGPNFSLPPRVISCHSVTMEEFALLLRSFAGDYLTGPVLDSTGLKGAWDFDLKETPKAALSFAGADGITLFEAVDKQLGLKLEPGKVSMPVLVVDSANEKPTPNLPEVKTALPPPPPEFEVASVRPSPPGTNLGPPPTLQPGGVRYEAHGLPLSIMIAQAWQPNNPPGVETPGTPKWLTLFSPLFDIVAEVPATAIASGTQLYQEDLQAMMRALLVDRFKMAAHYEDRPMDAYTLVAAKPKLKPADVSTRTGCKIGRSGAPRDPGSGPPPIVATCQNVTLAQFAERLQSIAPTYLSYPVLDGTAIQGAWDFTLTFSAIDPNRAGGGGRGGTKGGGPAPAAGANDVASDPIGGISLFDAVDKQLGLKLERHRRPEPVFVIDHIEEKPTEN
jgi:uncharacterized protein (TIGR03435 family)